MRNGKAVALLALNPVIEHVAFFKGLSDFGFDVFVVVDNNDFAPPEIPNVRFIQIDDHTCFRHGYTHFNTMITAKKPIAVSAWEKALLYFSRENKSYSHVWFVEDDVFMPSISTLPNIDVMHPDADIVSQGNEVNASGLVGDWPWWEYVPKEILKLPWAKSMVCAVRLSRALLKEVDTLIQENRRFLCSIDLTQKENLFFHEYLFHAIALHRGMKVETPAQLQSITWRRRWSVNEIRNENLYHPVKGWARQSEFYRALGQRPS